MDSHLAAVRVTLDLHDDLVPRVFQTKVQPANAREQAHRLHLARGKHRREEE